MPTWILFWWDRWRSGLWFIPSLMLTAAIVGAFAMLTLDAFVELQNVPWLKWLQTTPSAARTILGTLTGALVTVAGLTFSLVMLVLSQTSSQYGPRLLRTFMNHPMTQSTLGFLLGTSLYCLIVMRAIREQGEKGTGGDPLWQSNVPDISVMLGLVLSLACLILLIAFLNHIAQFIQAETVIESVSKELHESINRIFPEEIGSAPESDEAPPRKPTSRGAVVPSQKMGYLSALDLDSMLALAIKHDLVIVVEARPGHFVAEGVPLARLHPADLAEAVEGLIDQVEDCCLTNPRRTPRQDVECTILELVELAVRALSPGINDPFTAIACVDHLSAELAHLARRKTPSAFRMDKEGKLRLFAKPITFPEALDAAFLQLRQAASGKADLLIRMLEGLRLMAASVDRPDSHAALRRHAEMIHRDSETAVPEPNDREDVDRRYRELIALIPIDTRPPAIPPVHV